MDSQTAFASLGLSPIAISIGPLDIRWYSLAYIAGIVAGWWYLLRLLAQPAAPMNRAQADDLVFYATSGVILGGRLGYVIFYGPQMILGRICSTTATAIAVAVSRVMPRSPSDRGRRAGAAR